MRYFFQTENGHSYPDEHGAELPDVRSACLEASKVLGDFLREKPQDLWATDFLSVTVSDQDRLVLFTLNLSVTLSAAMNGHHPDV